MDTLRRLRRYRELRRERDELIRRAAAAGHSRETIAAASGLSLHRVKQIVSGKNR